MYLDNINLTEMKSKFKSWKQFWLSLCKLNLRSNKTEFNAFYQRTVVAKFKKFGRSKQAELFNVQ